MKRIRRFGAFFALAATLALSGCALLPEEEVLPEAPVQRTGAQEAFTLDYVQRGDLVRTERYTATYRAVRQEQLCFAVSGVPFDEMYVSEGETVRSGQLLAKLDTGTFEEEAASQAAQIETLALEVQRQEENRALAQEKWEIEWSYMDEEAREDAAPLSEVLRPYDRAIEDLQGQIEVARVRQAQTEAYVRERQLRAGISGVVTYARSLEKGTLSDETEVVFTISDAGSSLFVLGTKDLENFPEGRTVEVVIGLEKQVYPCTVVGVQAGEDGAEGEVYLKPDDAAAALADGDRGAVTLELDRREDVLYVNASAVKRMDDKRFVYVQDENGLRAMAEVETGFEAGGFVEILSGLEEGDAVILK